MNRSWIYAFCGWVICLIALVWILSSPLAWTLSKSIAAEVRAIQNFDEEDLVKEELYPFLQQWILAIGILTIVGSQLAYMGFYYFYQRRERKIHLLFQDFISSFDSLPQKKDSRSLFSLRERNVEEVRDLKNEDLKLLVSALEEGVIILNERGEIELANNKALFSLDILSRQVLGKSFSEVLQFQKSPLGEKCLQMIAAVKEQKQERREHFEGQGVDKRFYELVGLPCVEGNKILLLIQDHSSDHKMLTMGKNFVTNASHELRTPITIIEGFTETLQEIPEISEEMFKEITNKILNNCHRMASVVKGLLVLADLDYSGKAILQPCDLVGLVESCSYTLLSAHSKVKIETLFNEKESLIFGDPDLLELAVLNLFENAVKYSRDPAFITVTVETLSDVVNVSVRDRGIGIAALDREHVFERFYTANKSHSRKLGGAGLGLSIVKMIMEKHGAKISVAPAEDQGTVFTMQFQKARAAQGV